MFSVQEDTDAGWSAWQTFGRCVMPRPENVVSKKWLQVEVVYDDGEYSAIVGVYNNGK